MSVMAELENSNNIRKTTQYDGAYLLILLLKYKWFVIITVFLASVLSISLSLMMPNWYSATANTVPSKTQGGLFQNMLGGLSSTLKNIGLTKLSGGSSQSYDFIVLMQSRTVIDSLIKEFDLSKEYEIPDSLHSKLYSAVEDNIDVTLEKEGNYTISILSKDKNKTVDMVNYFIQKVNELALKVAHKDAYLNKKYLETRIAQNDEIVKNIGDSLSSYSKKNFLFALEDQAKAMSLAYADMKSEEIKQETIYELMKSRFGENDAYTISQKELVDNLTKHLEDAKSKPGFGGNFSLNNATKVGIEYMRLLAEFETFTKVKSLLMPMLEEAKLDETKQTQSLIMIDPPLVPDKKTKPKRSLIVIGVFLGSFILATIFIVLFDGYKNFRLKYNELKHSEK